MAISKEILALVRMQLDKGSADAVSSAINKITKDVGNLEAATKKQAASATSMKSGFDRRVADYENMKSGRIPPNIASQVSNYEYKSGGLTSPYGSFGGKPILALPPGPKYTPEQTASMQSIIQMGPAVQETVQAVNTIPSAMQTAAESTDNLGDIFDLTSARFSAFSKEAIDKAQIVRQIMDQTGMSIKEAMEAANNMSVGGSKIPTDSKLDAEVGKVLNLQQGLINFSKGVKPFQNAAAGVDEALGENEMSAEDFNKMMEGTGSTLTDAAEKWKSFGAAFAGFQLRFVGESLDRFSKQLLQPVTKYVELMGIANKTSADWADAQKDVELATARIGRSMADVLLPTMKSLATTIEKLAAFFESNPGLVNAIAYGAIGIAVIGNVLRVAGTLLTAAAALKYIVPQLFGLATVGKAGAIAGTAAAGAATASASAAGATAGTAAAAGALGGMTIKTITAAILPYALPVIILALTAGAYKMYLNSDLAKERNSANAPGQLLSIIAKGLGGIFGDEAGNKAFFAMARFTGVLNDTAEAADKAAEALGPGSEILKAYISYMQQVKEIEKTYEEQRLSVIKEFGKQRAQIEKNYAKEIADIDAEIAKLRGGSSEIEKNYQKTITNITRDYQTNEKQQLEDHYKQRQKLAEEYNIDVQRSEEDHQRKMLYMQQDHDYKIMQLANDRDAFGIVAEEYQYERERSRAEEEYSIEAGRRSEDFARRLAEMEAQFSAERKRRIQEFRIRIQEQEIQRQEERAAEIAALQERRKILMQQHAEDLKQLDADHAEQLKMMETNKAKELKKMAAAFNDNLRMLDASLLGERATRIAYYHAMSKDLQAWLASMNGSFSSNLPGYPKKNALGGYVSGVISTGEEGKEFLLRNSTTRQLERAVGGRLTQENVLMGTGGARSVQVHQNFKFDSSMSESERNWFKKVAREEAVNGLMEALG